MSPVPGPTLPLPAFNTQLQLPTCNHERKVKGKAEIPAQNQESRLHETDELTAYVGAAYMIKN